MHFPISRLLSAAALVGLVGTLSSAQPALSSSIVPAPPGAGQSFGRSVAMHGTTLVVGAPGESSTAPGAGAAYVYEWRSTSWVQTARLAPPGLRAGDEFGYAVAITATTIVVGAPGDDEVRDPSGTATATIPDKGAAYLFERVADGWVLQARLDHGGVNGQATQPIAPGPDDRFGQAVGASKDLVMIGAPGSDGTWITPPLVIEDSGLVAVFEPRDGAWSLTGEARVRDVRGRPVTNARLGQVLAVEGRLGFATRAYLGVRSASTVYEEAGFQSSPWRVTPYVTGDVSESSPWRDGMGLIARFVDIRASYATATDVVLLDGTRARNVTHPGAVTTIAELPHDSTRVLESPTTFVSSYNGKQLFRGDFSGTQTFLAGNATFGLVDGVGATAGFGSIFAVEPDGQGNYYVADMSAIRRVTAAGAVTTVAGIPTVFGHVDGPLGVGLLGQPTALAYDPATQALYIADGATIRVLRADGMLETLAGVAGHTGLADGAGSAARFLAPRALTVASDGSLLLLDGANLRRVSPAGVVHTLIAASTTGRMVDGPADRARLANPRTLALAPDGTMFIGDKRTLRRVSATLDVQTIAGWEDGVPMLFGSALAVDDGRLAVGDTDGSAPFRPVEEQGGVVWMTTVPVTGQNDPAPMFPPLGSSDFGASIAFSQDTLFVGDASTSATTGRPVSAMAFLVDRWIEAYTLQPADLGAYPQFGLALAGSPRFVAVGAPATIGGPVADGAVFVFDIDSLDTDLDTLPDRWERRYGLDPSSATGDDGAAGDPDGDGQTNAEEHAALTHPRGLAAATRYFAEGARSSFFSTDVAIANPDDTPAEVLVRYAGPSGEVIAVPVTVPARQSRTVTVPQDAPGEFATRVETDVPVVVDRLMWWSADAPYGSHGEHGIEAPSTTWFFAEGATHSGFDLFYLLYNPSEQHASVRVRYLRGTGTPIEKTYEVGPGRRFNIWVNLEQFDGEPLLAAADVSARIDVLNGIPIIAERAMYRSAPGASASQPGALFAAGHESAGVTSPAHAWFFAEGATSSFFDLFILIANPDDEPSTVRARFLLGDGRAFTKDYVVAANSRFNIWVDQETFDGGSDAPLANVGEVSTTLEVLSGPPIVAERAMWWPGPTAATWTEAHNSPGATRTAARWATGIGRVLEGASSTDTYYLLANTGVTDATVTVTLLFDDGTAEASRTFTVGAGSRFTVSARAEFPQALGRRFGALVESSAGTPLVVEWAIYSDHAGQQWAAGANALATPIP